MRIKEGFRLRNVMGQAAIIGEGVDQMNFNKLIVLNSSAEYLWKEIEGKDFDINMLAELLVKEYDIDRNTAVDDARKVVAKWLEIGIIQNGCIK